MQTSLLFLEGFVALDIVPKNSLPVLFKQQTVSTFLKSVKSFNAYSYVTARFQKCFQDDLFSIRARQ